AGIAFGRGDRTGEGDSLNTATFEDAVSSMSFVLRHCSLLTFACRRPLPSMTGGYRGLNVATPGRDAVATVGSHRMCWLDAIALPRPATSVPAADQWFSYSSRTPRLAYDALQQRVSTRTATPPRVPTSGGES